RRRHTRFDCDWSSDVCSSDLVEASVVHFPAVKPLDEEAVLEHAANARLVVTVEEGVAIGGFGSAVTDLLVEEMGGSLPRLTRLALPDSFPQKYGVQTDLLEIYGLMPHQIAAAVAKSVSKKEKVA